MATYRRGSKMAGAAYVQGVAALHAYGRAVAQLFETYDVLLLSTLGQPAVPVGWILEDREQVAATLEYADGAIVGTALVRALRDGGVTQLAETARTLAAGTAHGAPHASA